MKNKLVSFYSSMVVTAVLLTPWSVRAETGTWPPPEVGPYNGLQIDYSIVGVWFSDHPNDDYGWTPTRSWTNGTLLGSEGPGYVALSGNVRNTENDPDHPGSTHTIANISLTVGDITTNISFDFNTLNDVPFDLRLTRDPSAATASLSIDLDGEYGNGETRSIEVLANGITGTAVRVIGPVIKANGLENQAIISPSDPLSITVQLDPGQYQGVDVDWWIIALAGSSWYYMDSVNGWTPFDGNPLNCSPWNMEALYNLPQTQVLGITGLPAGSYCFWFGIHYPMTGMLNLNEPILVDEVTVIVQ